MEHQVAIGTYVMLVLWDPDVACDKPLAFWCIGSILRLALVCMSAYVAQWSIQTGAMFVRTS